MRNTFTRLTAIASAATLLSGCAGSYHAIQPERLTSYQSASASGAPLDFSYRYNALIMNGANKKYVKKERKRGYQIVAVQLRNNTVADLNFSRDLELTFADRPIQPVSSLQASEDLKQGVAIYLLYVLGIGQVGGTYDPYTGQTTGGTILPWGPVVAGGNMLGASAANKNMRNEFARYDLTNKVLHPGETVYGIVALRETGIAPLKINFRNSAAVVPVTVPAPINTVPSNGGQ
ncbi:hypothetical protein CDA63_18065 [Hymenobacter amundsenii]|uniref:DUF3313 domain-containing protein n=1 Tax=Hymenobacter amundsenii TaxID=2006685 RepID=A0A246FGN8_9BACT|nr:hypothetical protein [Hymenobacter amundsenii]OWP61688.1 hypothetical protein CDA63_18065 [Hymenobacter amundsenii]